MSVLALAIIPARAQQQVPVDVLTHHNDNSRTGANLGETVLTTTNVSAQTFGKLFSLGPLDGYVYAQPLVVSGLSTSVGVRDVAFVATEHNSVYAFDATGARTAPLWQVNLGPSAPEDPLNDNENATVQDCFDLTPEIGITSTPVIDRATGTLYAVAKTRDGDGFFHQHLWALGIADGSVRGVVEIAATLTTGDTTLTFDPQIQLNRPALLLANGTVYLAFGSHCDYGPYNGWVIAYSAATLQQTSVYSTTPTGTQGSVWQSGEGLSADADGNIYFLSANGTNGVQNVSDSFVKLSTAGGGMTLADWFTPAESAFLSEVDADLGSGGALLVPDSNLVVGGGKEGRLYVVDRANMGQQTSDDSGAVQSFQVSDNLFDDQINGGVVFWNGPSGARIFIWPNAETLRSYAFDGNTFNATPIGQSSVAAPPDSFPGGALSISANGGTAGSGILWAIAPNDVQGEGDPPPPAVLRAFDADDVSHELWNSELDPADNVGAFAKFNPPTVANGRVYVPTFSGTVQVYGLKSESSGGGGALPSPWVSQDVGATGIPGSATFASGAFTVSGAGDDIWENTDAFQFVNQAVTGDTEIAARVVSMQNTNEWAKAGLMLRESLSADAAFVIIDETPGGSIEFMTRTAAGQAVTPINNGNLPAPAWLRLARTGTTVTGQISADGVTWTTVGTATFTSANVLSGLIVCSHDSSTLNDATFDSVSVTSGGTGGGSGGGTGGGGTGGGGTGGGGTGGGTTGPSDVVIYASDITSLHGSWSAASDATSPNGVKLVTPNVGVSNTAGALASPTDYIDVSFDAAADTPYTIWLRLKALNNDKFNDSVFLQFSDALADGGPVYGIGTSSGLLVNLATDSSASSLNDWGWQNGAYWLSQAATLTFASAGTHTMRVQVREDGVELDQIVLSASTYLSAPPGPVGGDSTIVAKPSADSGGSGGSGGGPTDVVIYASDVTSANGSWSVASDETAANGTKLVTSNAGVSNTASALSAPTDYFDVAFNAAAATPYTIWLRMKALNNDKFNDSVWVQFSDASVNGSAVYALNTTSALLVNLATDAGASSLSNWGWQNGAYWLSQPVTVTFASGGAHTLRVQVREDGVQIDQIVLSPTTYLNAAPGGPTNDTTIVSK